VLWGREFRDGGFSLYTLSVRRGGPSTERFLLRMAKNIYVGNLVWDCTADDLLALFQAHGQVARAQVITDRETGRSRGFGFVEMNDDAEAQKAIEALNGADFKGRPLTVNEAKPREERSGGGGGGRGGYGGGRGGGGGGRGGYGGGRGDRGNRY
jgi:RNA recognition motif-containing protein